MIFAFIQKEIDAGRTFEKIYYVGDREYDFRVSREVNIDFIGIDFKGNGKLKALGIKNVINDYDPIEKFLMLV